MARTSSRSSVVTGTSPRSRAEGYPALPSTGSCGRPQPPARLLAAAPKIRVLATSREPLGVTGEVLCPVAGRLRPPRARPNRPARTGRYAPVRLFADRAADVAPGFTVDEGTVAAVQRICHTLDGLPLAIELAAARLRALPVTEVAARLDDRFRLLSRAARPRHQTLRAVVAGSGDLLDSAAPATRRRGTGKRKSGRGSRRAPMLPGPPRPVGRR